MDLKEWLLSYGLNESETKVYLSILENPNIKVADIQRQTHIVRTTLYHNISLLKAKGLISESKTNNVSVYKTTGTNSFKSEIEHRIKNEKKSLLSLIELEKDLNNNKQNKLHGSYIERFEGTNAVKQSIENAFRCDNKSWLIIAPVDNFLMGCSKKYQSYYLSEKKRRNIRSRTLWDPTKEINNPTLKDLFFRAPKKLPEEYRDNFKSLFIIYDNTTLIIDSYEQKTAHAIYNNDSTTILKLMFNSMWEIAEDY